MLYGARPRWVPSQPRKAFTTGASGGRSAHALVEKETEELVLAEELHDVPGKLVRGVDLGGTGGDALAGERADVVDGALRVRRTLRHGHASARDERDEDEQEGEQPTHFRLRSVGKPRS